MTRSTHHNLSLGCAVWAYRGFIGNLYPEHTTAKNLLPLYTDRLTAVEGNTTFYAMPPAETLLGWREHMPAHFAFCPKLDRRITHEGNLLANKKLTMLFLERMTLLEDNLGPVLMQLPPSFSPASFQELKRYLSWWPHDQARLALEVRHPGWWQPAPGRALNELCTELGIARVLLDTRPIYSNDDDPQATNERKKPNIPMHPVVTAPFTFVRFIAHPDPEPTRPFLEQWIDQVAEWLREGTQVYFFSHCPIEEHSPGYARDFYRGLEKQVDDLPALPWDHAKEPPKQLGLFG